MVRVSHALGQISKTLQDLVGTEEPPDRPPSKLVELIEQRQCCTEEFATSLGALYNGMSATPTCYLLKSMSFMFYYLPCSRVWIAECDFIMEASSFLQQTRAFLAECIQSWDCYGVVFLSLHDWLAQLESSLTLSLFTDSSATVPEAQSASGLRTLLLVIAQDLLSLSPSTGSAHTPEEIHLVEEVHRFKYIHQHMRLERVEAELTDVLRGLHHPSPSACIQSLVETLPYLESLLQFVEPVLALHSQWLRALFKQNYILASIVRNLSELGFCQGAEEPLDGDAGDPKLSREPGTGFGEGTGMEQVTDGPVGEEQLEGLENEKGMNQQGEDGKDDGDGMEWDNMDDATSEIAEPLGEDADENRGDQKDEALEEEIDDLDPTDPNVLDEKIWGEQPSQEGNAPTEEAARTMPEQMPEGDIGSSKASTDNAVESSPDDEKKTDQPASQENEMPDVGENPELPEPGVLGEAMPSQPEPEMLDLPDNFSIADGNDVDSSVSGEDVLDGPELDLEEQAISDCGSPAPTPGISDNELEEGEKFTESMADHSSGGTEAGENAGASSNRTAPGGRDSQEDTVPDRRADAGPKEVSENE